MSVNADSIPVRFGVGVGATSGTTIFCGEDAGFCGAVRFVCDGRPVKVNLCHCQMCRKASGAPVVAWAAYERTRVRFENEPTWRQSSAKMSVCEASHGTRAPGVFCASAG